MSRIVSRSWSCSGTSSGTTANCSANISVPPVSAYSVTPSAGTGSRIIPSRVQTVNFGATTSFTVGANAGYGILSVTGGGTLSGAVYTTAAVTSNCSVTVTAVTLNGDAAAVLLPPSPTP